MHKFEADKFDAALDALCRSIELSWPGVLAAHSGFALPRMPVEDTDAVVEVFFVDSGMEQSVIRGTYQQRKSIGRRFDRQIALVCHDEAATNEYYREDVQRIRTGSSSNESYSSLDAATQLPGTIPFRSTAFATTRAPAWGDDRSTAYQLECGSAA